MNIISSKKAWQHYFNLLCEVPRKICNTLYYLLTDKDKLLVVNASVFQFFDNIQHFNIGDDLNVYMLRELTGKRIFIYNQFYHRSIENYMCIGSTIDWMANLQTKIWGSGVITPAHESRKLRYLNPNNIYAVRGTKTRECFNMSGVACSDVFGDPALLLPYIYKPEVDKVKGRIGFMPHFYDKEDKNLLRLIKQCGDNAYVIKVQGYKSWKKVVEEILSCEFIISSSLHGLILSDAYMIPNLWVTFAKRLKGGRFKFEDYYSAVGKEGCEFVIGDNTSIGDLLEKQPQYKQIVFDPIPLLKSCPFKITNEVILKMIKKGNN